MFGLITGFMELIIPVVQVIIPSFVPVLNTLVVTGALTVAIVPAALPLPPPQSLEEVIARQEYKLEYNEFMAEDLAPDTDMAGAGGSIIRQAYSHYTLEAEIAESTLYYLDEYQRLLEECEAPGD